jgi:hypothetical protein
MDRQSIIMLRLFCALEVILVVLVATCLPFPAFVVLHQLLLAYPGNKFFEIVAAVMCLLQDSEEQLLPLHHSVLQEEHMFLKELEEEQKQMLAKLDGIEQSLRQVEESLTRFQLPAGFQNSIRELISQTMALRSWLVNVHSDLTVTHISVTKITKIRCKILQWNEVEVHLRPTVCPGQAPIWDP